MPTPSWIGATPNQPQLAANVNQFLGTHATTYVYTGAVVSSQSTAGSGSVDSNGLYVAQSFTTGASTTAAGRVVLTFSVTGTPSPLTVQIQANNTGAPSGTPLVTTVIPPNWGSGTAAALSIPLPVTGLSPSTTYWIVAQPAGDGGDFFAFSKSNQTSGASTSTNGTSWTAQAYGLLYTVYDQSPIMPLVHTWSDSGARITAMLANSSGNLGTLEEYTTGQGSGQYVYSNRSLTYSSGRMVSVT